MRHPGSFKRYCWTCLATDVLLLFKDNLLCLNESLPPPSDGDTLLLLLSADAGANAGFAIFFAALPLLAAAPWTPSSPW